MASTLQPSVRASAEPLPRHPRARFRGLDSLAEPADLRKLPREELPRVAEALRAALIGVGAEVGGHFAGSLGTVELSLGLHYVYDTPRDRLVWDVGHQAYGHKALTGRLGGLRKVKQADGPSGFLRRCESKYDTFGAGHAGTSVSAGLGMAEAFRQRGDEARVAVVIGDGAATSGMSFEAFNHAGELGIDLGVVFNDNGMSIAPSVGGMHRNRKQRAYFEALGLRYLGPVDGHDLRVLVPALEKLRSATGPTVLHVQTYKGRGFEPAEADPYGWHATKPFDLATGKRASGGSGGAPSWTAAFSTALDRILERDRRVVAITAAMPDGTGLSELEGRHPGRIFDVGIAEQHAVTFAAGLAAEGYRPVCAIYSTFLQRAFDQIVHDVALQELPVVFALDRAGLVGGDGPTHHGVFDLAYLRPIPNLVIAAPRDENELQHLLATAVESGRPFALRYPRGTARGVAMDGDPKALPIGRGEQLRSGGDVALVGIGKSVACVEQAAESLAQQGIQATVIDARFAKPLDEALLVEAAERCGSVVSVEDHVVRGGFGSALLELLASRVPTARVLPLGIGDRFVDHGDAGAQWREHGIDAESVVAQVRDLLEEGGAR